MSGRAPVLGLLSLAALLAACGEAQVAREAARVPLLVTLAPASAGVAADPHDLPDGARLVRVEPWPGGAAPVDLGAGLVAAGRARVAYDGRSVLFIAREREGGPLGVWRCRPDGSQRERAVLGATDQPEAAWLPDGRIVCTQALADTTPRRWTLAVAPGDGRPAERITFGVLEESDPEVLPDGRIVFAMRRATPAGASFALWSVHTDGTGADLYHRPEREAGVLQRPRVLPDGRVVALQGPTAAALGALLVDARAPLKPSTALPGMDEPLAAVEPMADGGLLVAGATSGLTRVGADGVHAVLRVAAVGERVLDVAVLEPRRVPQGHLSLVDARRDWGQVVVVDARPAGQAQATHLRVLAASAATSSVEALGSVALASDGSAFLRLPPDMPLWFEVLGPEGPASTRTHAALWVRPNETRGCVGCHDERDTAPPNRRPLAVLAAAVRLPADTGSAPAEAAR